MQSTRSTATAASLDALLSEAEARHVEMGITPEMKVEIDAARGLLRAAQQRRQATEAWAASAAAALRDDVAATAALVDARQRELSSVYRSQLNRHELDAWADIDERCSAAQSRILQAQKTLELVREGKGDAFVV